MDSNNIQGEFFSDMVLYNEKSHGKSPTKVKFSKKDGILCYIFFFLMGVCHFLPLTFFSAANNFWLSKFGEFDDNNTNSAENRAYLQKNFGSASTIANTIPVIGLGIFNVVYANNFKNMNRIMLTFGIQFVIFIFFTITTKINTDNHQVPFFLMVMLFCAILAGAVTINMVASMTLYTRFPHKYMKTAFIGEGASGMVGSTLNVITVAVFNGELVDATLTYFLCGTFVVGLTFLMSIIMSRNSGFTGCIGSIKESKKIPSIKELKNSLKQVWFAVILLGLVLLGIASTHTSITSLVTSEQPQNSSTWAKDYFSPVMTFCLTDASFLLGRFASSFIPVNLPDYVLLILAALRMVTVVPGIWLCNAQPRNHLPVIFKHDYQYGIMIFVTQFTSGYFLNMSFLHIAKTISDPEEADIAYTVFGLCSNVLQTITSPLGLFIVKIL